MQSTGTTSSEISEGLENGFRRECLPERRLDGLRGVDDGEGHVEAWRDRTQASTNG